MATPASTPPPSGPSEGTAARPRASRGPQQRGRQPALRLACLRTRSVVFVPALEGPLSSGAACAATCCQAQEREAGSVAGDGVWRASSLRDAGTTRKRKSGTWGFRGLCPLFRWVISSRLAPVPRRACEAPRPALPAAQGAGHGAIACAGPGLFKSVNRKQCIKVGSSSSRILFMRFCDFKKR